MDPIIVFTPHAIWDIILATLGGSAAHNSSNLEKMGVENEIFGCKTFYETRKTNWETGEKLSPENGC